MHSFCHLLFLMGYRTTAVARTLLLICCTLSSSALTSFPANNDGKCHPRIEPDDQLDLYPSPTTINNSPPPSTIIDTAKSLFSPVSTTGFALLREAASNSWTWIKLKTLLLLFKQSQGYPSSAPSLEKQANVPEKASLGADAAAEKVKEAIFKSLDQGTVVIENSARSAAKLVGDVMDNTAKKLQKTLGTQSEAEL